MKEAIFLFGFFTLSFVSCSDDKDEIDSSGTSATLVGFSEDFSANFLTDLDDSALMVPVNLIAYPNGMLPTVGITLNWTVDPNSTAVLCKFI